MFDSTEYIDLVRKAQFGDQNSREKLSKLVLQPLQAYVFRITLREDVAQDIVQETLVEMLKVLGKLKRADRFWPWLCGIALNRIRRHRQNEARRRTVNIVGPDQADWLSPDDPRAREGLAELVQNDLRQIIFHAMDNLRPRYRTVLTLRCYEEMDYADIAEVMECTEFTARVLFFRAKKALARQLARNGFGRGSLLIALVLFGKLTAPNPAAAAQVTISASSLKVGTAATLAGLATSTGPTTGNGPFVPDSPFRILVLLPREPSWMRHEKKTGKSRHRTIPVLPLPPERPGELLLRQRGSCRYHPEPPVMAKGRTGYPVAH